MLYKLKRRENTIFDEIDWGDKLRQSWRDNPIVLCLTYQNQCADMLLSCELHLNDNPRTYEIVFASCDDIFGHVVKKYKTIDFAKVCDMIHFLKEVVESADFYGEKETKNETLYKECINTIRQYFNAGGKLDEFDGFCEDLPRKDL